MAGKGSRQRTYGSAFEANYERIFGKDKADQMGTEWVAEDTLKGPQSGSARPKQAPSQYPQEARERSQKGSQAGSEDVES